MMENEMYTAPMVEVIVVEVEQGFAASFDTEDGDPIYGG